MVEARAGERRQWLSDAQFRSVLAGLRVVDAWVSADEDPDLALGHALRREPDVADVVVGLATVSRLLAIDLAAVTGRTEGQVLRDIDLLAHRLQSRREPEGAP